MAQNAAKIRLCLTDDLSQGRKVAASREQAHYLLNVMRLSPGQSILVFNGRDGEWLAEITGTGKRAVELTCLEQTKSQSYPPDVWLCFAPIKKARTDFIAEKAAEMGCARLQPVFTRFTNSERVRTDRLAAHAVEAAEQCGLLSVPEVAQPKSLDALLADWPTQRRLMFCDESGGPAATLALRDQPSGPWAILIGPEGGFTPDEAARLRDLPFTIPVSLGPRILRADTAAVAALAIWQAVIGDWTAT